MNRTLKIGLAAITFATVSSFASADIIWSDNFNRNNSNTVGNGWVEDGASANDVAIVNGRLRLRNNQSSGPDAAATQFTISTLGFNNIGVTFSWAPLTASEDSDLLYASWKLSSVASWTDLGSLGLGGTGGFLTQIYALSLSAADTSIDFRFWTDVSPSNTGNNEGAYIDYVNITGDVIQQTNVPEPASIALLGLGLAGLGFSRRKQAA